VVASGVELGRPGALAALMTSLVSLEVTL